MKNQETKQNPMLKMLSNSLKDLPTPSSISLLWNMGFLSGMALTLQLITGILISMTYIPEMSYAFSSVMMIMRDIDTGWLPRIMHMNGASLFFILLYSHMMRGLYFSSPGNQPKVWVTGTLLLLLSMATAFLGYVLPWSQMSFWGATVITGVIAAIPLIGTDMVHWIWGGSSVSQPTLNRFFSLHFIIPMAILAMALVHLILLHETGSSNPLNAQTNKDKIKFMPTFLIKDTLPALLISLSITILSLNNPFLLGDPETFLIANPMVAPIHIQPEWYFLFAYVILRSIPSKLGGVISLVASILIFIPLATTKNKSNKITPQKKILFWFLVTTTVVLTWIGAKPVEPPFEGIGQVFTTCYMTSLCLM